MSSLNNPRIYLSDLLWVWDKMRDEKLRGAPAFIVDRVRETAEVRTHYIDESQGTYELHLVCYDAVACEWALTHNNVGKKYNGQRELSSTKNVRDSGRRVLGGLTAEEATLLIRTKEVA